MPAVLSITAADILTTARLDAANTADLADANAILAAEQESLETIMRPDALHDARLTPLIKRQIVKLLAAELIALRMRENGGMEGGTFQGAGILVSGVPDQANLLRTEARHYLAPYLRRALPIALPLPSTA